MTSNNICFFDLESTGLNVKEDRITQIAWLVCDLDSEKILSVGMSYLYDTDYPVITEEITKLTGISEALLKYAGWLPSEALNKFKSDILEWNVSYLCAHNFNGFDGPLLKAELSRAGVEWNIPHGIDTKTDIDFPSHITGRRLLHITAELELPSYPPHNALFDTLALRRVFFSFDWKDAVRNSKTPTIHIYLSANYDTREEAKKRGYYFEGNTKKWAKDIKENKLKEEIDKAKPFKITVIND